MSEGRRLDPPALCLSLCRCIGPSWAHHSGSVRPSAVQHRRAVPPGLVALATEIRYAELEYNVVSDCDVFASTLLGSDYCLAHVGYILQFFVAR